MLDVDESAIKQLAHDGYVPEFGARPLARAIQQKVMVPISQKLLAQPQTERVRVTVKHGEIVVE